jgi:signal transduction histidine kinase
LPADVQIAVYRIAQESLNNAIKHSGASRCLVDLWCHADGLELAVSDNGQGFDPRAVTSERLGLRIMAERAQAIGAQLTVDSQPDEGVHIRLLWRQPAKGD